MTGRSTTDRLQVDPVPAWGLGDVVLGVLAAQFLAVVATVVAMGIAGWRTSEEIPLWGGAILQVPLWFGYLGAVVLAARTKGRGVVEDFGFRFRPLDAPLGLVVGLAMAPGALPILCLPLLKVLDKTSDDLSAPAKQLTDKAQGAAGWVVLVLIVVVGAPLVEELFFRGLLLRSLQKRGLSDLWSCVVCAAVFAAIHLQPLQFLGLFAVGLVLSVLAVRTGRLGPSIWTHAAFNATSVAILYAGR